MRKTARVLAATGLSVATAVATVSVGAVAASASPWPPTITVTLSPTTVNMSVGHTVHAGRVIFKVLSTTGDHTLQLAQIAKRGYTFTQASKDVNAAFSGNVKAVRTIDRNIRWLGGADATPGHPGYFAETLYAGKYFLVDQNGTGANFLNVVGSPQVRAWVHESSIVTAVVPNRFRSSSTLPRAGWTLFRNAADEPHFLVLQAVKPGTTAADVQAATKNPAATPPWALPFSTSTGVISPGEQILWHYNAPPGRYLMACFWPDDQTGMPHFFMGMWKLVTLK